MTCLNIVIRESAGGCEASKLGLDRIAKQKRLEKELTKGLEVMYCVWEVRLF